MKITVLGASGCGSGAGKSTIARRLADRHGLWLYSTDDVMGDHADRCAPEDCPYLDAFRRMDMDERWVSRSPEIMLETFHWFRGEGFELILEDLRRFGSRERVIVEGFRLLPDRVAAQPGTRHRSVWLLPTLAFRRSAFERRGTLWAIAGRTTDPGRALANLLERDRLFTERLRRDAARLGLPAIDVDGSIDRRGCVDESRGGARRPGLTGLRDARTRKTSDARSARRHR